MANRKRKFVLRVPVTPEDREYFDSLEATLKVEIEPEQRAWYVSQRELLGELMLQEFPSTPDEAFAQSQQGRWYTQQLQRARKEQRIGHFGVLVEPRRDADRIGEVQACQINGQRRINGRAAASRQMPEQGSGHAMGTLGLKSEQQGAGKAIERHDCALTSPRSTRQSGGPDFHPFLVILRAKVRRTSILSNPYNYRGTCLVTKGLRPEGLGTHVSGSRLKGGSCPWQGRPFL